jgi:hypothetical protein
MCNGPFDSMRTDEEIQEPWREYCESRAARYGQGAADSLAMHLAMIELDTSWDVRAKQRLVRVAWVVSSRRCSFNLGFLPEGGV